MKYLLSQSSIVVHVALFLMAMSYSIGGKYKGNISTCKDTNRTFKIKKEGGKTCIDLYLWKYTWVCKKNKRIQKLCPATCNKCPGDTGGTNNICRDTLTTFRIKGILGKSCKDLNLLRYNWVCMYNGKIQKLCPKTCNKCNNKSEPPSTEVVPTPAPAPAPEPRPTISPSFPPTEEPSYVPSSFPEKADNSLSFPLRGAFYYPWYPETWRVGGEKVFYRPKLGYYESISIETIDQHISFMEYAKIDVAIASWWGPRTVYELERMPMLLNRTLVQNANVKWAYYYEKEMKSNPSVYEIESDLEYLFNTYANHEAIAKIEGKPVMFVYNDGRHMSNGFCAVTQRWSQGNTKGNWHIVLKVFRKYWECSHQPDSWHQYSPVISAAVHSDSYVISPGFWRADLENPHLARDVVEFYQNIRNMVASNKSWQLITTFNEWGEGTAVEPARQWSSNSGYGIYLDALHRHGIKK